MNSPICHGSLRRLVTSLPRPAFPITPFHANESRIPITARTCCTASRGITLQHTRWRTYHLHNNKTSPCPRSALQNARIQHAAFRLHSSVSRQGLGKAPMPDHLDDKEKAIFEKLSEAFEPVALEVQDISGGCGSMYAVAITSERFKGLSVIKQHRLVNEILGEDIKSWHGIQLRTKSS